MRARRNGTLNDLQMPQRRPAEEWLARIDRSDSAACWPWPGSVDDRGYGVAGNEWAHRWTYEYLVGPVAGGMELDHLCHTESPDCQGGSTCLHRRCVNPSHLEPVTHAENVLRSAERITHCPAGHEYVGRNVILDQGKRKCRTCRQAQDRARRPARGAAPVRSSDLVLSLAGDRD